MTIDEIMQRMSHPDPGVRAEAVYSLGYLRDPRAFEPAMNMYRDVDVRVRRKVIEVAWMFHNQDCLPFLLAMVQDEDVTVRSNAVWLIGVLGDTSVVEPLIEALKDENAIVRLYAVHWLGKLYDSRAVEPLLKMLNDPDAAVRDRAAASLGHFHDARIIPALIAVLDHPPLEIGQVPIDNVLDEDISSGAVIGLAWSGTAAIEPLLEVLSTTNPVLLGNAVEALGFLCAKQATSVIISLLNHEDEYVQQRARWALKRIPTPEAQAAYNARSGV
jgi:HEAT repeat protein